MGRAVLVEEFEFTKQSHFINCIHGGDTAVTNLFRKVKIPLVKYVRLHLQPNRLINLPECQALNPVGMGLFKKT